MSKFATIVDQITDQHSAIVGKTGSGKTWAAKGIVERLLKRDRQVCVLDPTSAWWGMRLSADGKGRGFDVVLLGGEHGDIPLAARSGEAVARLVTEQGANVIIDTGGFGVGEYTRWFIDFAGVLYTTISAPLHLVIDEAHYFMPQGKVLSPDAGKMLHAGNRLMSGGRSRGIRGMMITQRPAKLHKDSLTCADTLIAMRVLSPQDRGAIKDWIDGAGDQVKGKEIIDSLAQLQRGDGWIWYPEGGILERVTFPAITTYDSSAAPKHGAKAGPQVQQIDLTKVKAAMAEAVKEAEANDPKLLRAEVARLKGEIGKLNKSPTAPPKADPVAAERAAQAAKRDMLKSLQPFLRPMGQSARELSKAQEALSQRVQSLCSCMSSLDSFIDSLATATPNGHNHTPFPRAAEARPQTRMITPPRGAVAPRSAGAGDSSLGKCERSILQVLAQFPDGCEGDKLAMLSGYRWSGGFRNSLGALRTYGYIDGANSGVMRITDAGVGCGPFDPLPQGEALRDYWLNHPSLGKCERTILSVIFDAYPAGFSAVELAHRTGYEWSGGFRNALGKLRTAGLLIGRNTGVMSAADHLFDGASA